MRIANPIYDVVFKYLLDDEKVAKLVLSALLGREILSLDFRATEVRTEVPRPVGAEILVLRLDFAATLRQEDGSRKLVLIEIQKAHTPWDVLRFRRYLGSQYASAENVYVDPAGRKQALPLVTIYFLGEGLECIDAPVVKVNRHYTDVATGEEIAIADPFVEALTHDTVVVQVDKLKNRRRTELEQLLAVFDQGHASRSDPHLLDILEENFPERYREVLRRLMRAAAEKDVRDRMDVEDEVVATLQENARKEEELRKVIEEMGQALGEMGQALGEKDQALGEKDKALGEKDQALGEKDKALGEKDKALEEKDKALEEKDKALQEKDRLIAELKRHLDR